jgi:TolB-like protein/class 3 adenylate cyclase/Flp pilus assembly protein TadD
MAEEGFKRKLAAILSADVEGYSRLMGDDEEATVRTLTAYRNAIADLTQQFRGRVVDSPGDNILAEFTSVVDAVNCAVEIQRDLAERNAELPYDRQMQFRIGVNLGDVIEEKDRIYGDGVNIAARVESLSEAGGICISGRAYDQVENKLGLGYENLGEHTVKNIERPIRVYRVLSHPGAAAHRVIQTKEKLEQKWRKFGFSVAAIVIVVVALGIWQIYKRSYSVTPAPVEKKASQFADNPSIAVLPFTNLSDDPKQEYFADGMTDELITDLSKISGLRVISRNSSFTYKGKTVKVQQVANELNVKYVLEGSIQRAGKRVRIRAQLIDGVTDHHLWAESYDAVMENIFDLQDKITKKIAAVLEVKLTAKEQNRLANKETTNIQAYDAFVKGWENLHRETPDDLGQAISLFKEAIELDPKYSRAQAALAWAYLSRSLRLKWQDFLDPHNRLRLMARKHLKLALRNPSSTAHLVASKMALYRRKYEESVTHAEHALAFDTNDPESNLNMALVLMATGKPEKGLEFVEKTMQLDPRNMAAPLSAAGMAHFIMGDLQKAAMMTERAIDHNPTIAGRYESLSAIYALLGRNQDAQVAHSKSIEAWNFGRFPANLTTIMSSFLVKDRQVADRYADGLVKAGWLGKPSEYYKIYDENRLTGVEIRNLVVGQEITIHEYNRKYWINHSSKGRAKDISRAREGKWWIEGDMLCYQMESGTLEGLTDCGEIYRNPDSLPGSSEQFLYVKDYSIAALTTKE